MQLNIDDEIIKTALTAVNNREAEILLANESAHVFSDGFEEQMRVLMKRRRSFNTNQRAKKRFITIIAAIAIIAALASVVAARELISKFIIDTFEKYSHFYFETDSSVKSEDDIFVVYLPSYIPDGFELILEQIDIDVLIAYEKGNDYVIYSQAKKHTLNYHINTEGVSVEYFDFNGFSAFYYSNQGTQNLFWYDDTYLFSVTSSLSKDTVFAVAESVAKK